MQQAKEMKKSTIIICLIIIILIQLGARIYVGFKKEYFHIDEAYSYSLMNYDKIQITENEDFYDTWHTKDYYIDYLSINEDEIGDLKPVYENQKNDVHPPLYYLLLRISAMFTINEFTKWTGLALNMLIFIFSSIFIYLISAQLFKNKKMALLTCLITGLTLGALDTTAYIRMYELANLFVLILTYLHMKIYNEKELKIKNLCFIGISALLASLTHYYTIIYMAILFIIFVAKYIMAKEYKNLIKYVSSFAIAAILSVIIFPHSLTHMFGGYRGQENTENLLNGETLFIDIGQYLYILSKNLLNILTIPMIILYIILYKRKKQHVEENSKINLIFVPMIIYFILVAKISSYKELRYMMPIISVSMIYIIYIFNKLFKENFSNKKAEILTGVLFITTIITPLFVNLHLDFTYLKMNHLVERIQEKSEIPTLYVFNENHIRFLDDICIFTEIEESYIMKYSNTNIDNIKEVMKDKDISNGIIFVHNEGVEAESIVEDIMHLYNFEHSEIMQGLNAGKVMYLH